MNEAKAAAGSDVRAAFELSLRMGGAIIEAAAAPQLPRPRGRAGSLLRR